MRVDNNSDMDHGHNNNCANLQAVDGIMPN